MTALLERPQEPDAPPASERAPEPADHADGTVLFAVLVLLAAAVLSFREVFVGMAWLRPVLGAVLLSAGLAWSARRVGLGPVGSLILSVFALGEFLAVAFLADTLVVLLLPTPRTVAAAGELFREGLELIQVRPSPTFAEAPLLALVVVFVWATAHVVEGLVAILHAPLRAALAALVLWSVPLVIAPQGGPLWVLVAPFAAAVALLLFVSAARDHRAWGRAVAPSGAAAPQASAAITGTVIAIVAVLAGVALAGAVPGYRATPWYEVRGSGGTTITTNPIVDIRQRLVATDTGPVLRVRTDRPVYLRTTALDLYSEREEWTSSGIAGRPVDGEVRNPLVPPVSFPAQADVTVAGIDPGAILVPAPYLPTAVSGPAAEFFQYDPNSATFTLDQGEVLDPGETYTVTAAVPAGDPGVLRSLPFPAQSPYLALPPTVPPEVAQRARDIVNAAGATTMFDMALALQEHLRTWQYSLQPEPGHGATAMLRFIDAQEGYCEQFAGTMAVMARTLGIPTRVAVGYTPGTVGTTGEYVITNANAHAWVEVLFGEYGWVAFEPTPRDDGNVLVPSGENVAPGLTQAQQQGEANIPPAPGPGEIPQSRPSAQPGGIERPTEAGDIGAFGGGSAGRGLRTAGLVLLALAAVGGGTALVVKRLRRQVLAGLPPAERALRAGGRVEVVGRGLGQAPQAGETDREYLHRIAGDHPASTRLADTVTAAAYAPAVSAAEADAADHAALELDRHLLEDVAPPRRVLVRGRGALAATIARRRRHRAPDAELDAGGGLAAAVRHLQARAQTSRATRR